MTRLVTRVVDTRYRPDVGTVISRVNRLTGAREVLWRPADGQASTPLVPIPAPLVPLLDRCVSPAQVRGAAGRVRGGDDGTGRPDPGGGVMAVNDRASVPVDLLDQAVSELRRYAGYVHGDMHPGPLDECDEDSCPAGPGRSRPKGCARRSASSGRSTTPRASTSRSRWPRWRGVSGQRPVSLSSRPTGQVRDGAVRLAVRAHRPHHRAPRLHRRRQRQGGGGVDLGLRHGGGTHLEPVAGHIGRA